MVLVYDGGNNNMTSVTLSSLCLDRTKNASEHPIHLCSTPGWDYCRVKIQRGVSAIFYFKTRLLCWYLSLVCGLWDNPRSSFFSSSLGFPSPKPMPDRPLRHSRAARSNLTLTTASPQTSSLSIPHAPAPIPHWSWSPNLHHNKDRREGGWGGEGVRGLLRSVRKNGRGGSARGEWWSHRLAEKKKTKKKTKP